MFRKISDLETKKTFSQHCGDGREDERTDLRAQEELVDRFLQGSRRDIIRSEIVEW